MRSLAQPFEETADRVPPPARAPETVEETGIAHGTLLNLVIKAMHVRGLATFPQLCEQVMLSRAVVHGLLEDARELALVEARGLTDSADRTSEMRYALTSKGHSWAAEALGQSQYVGPAPVTLRDFSAQVARQSILKERIDADRLGRSLDRLVVPQHLVHRLGPAVNSGKSILLYGAPGNGKTCIAEAAGRAFQQTIYLPHCIEVDGQIINFFDETVHHRVDPPAASPAFGSRTATERSKEIDRRWIACRRPVVLTGGELTLGMLDLTFNPFARFYEAPLQLKAAGGVFVVDDFGRQQTLPQAILNRWIIPLERGQDYLTLHTGKKFPVPFDQLVMFSTNIPPHDLADEATLRRLYYKIEVPLPSEDDYRKIFDDVCAAHRIPVADDLVSFLFDEFYAEKGLPRAGYHPKFLIEQVVAICEYEGIPVRLDKELLRIAWHNLYAR